MPEPGRSKLESRRTQPELPEVRAGVKIAVYRFQDVVSK